MASLQTNKQAGRAARAGVVALALVVCNLLPAAALAADGKLVVAKPGVPQLAKWRAEPEQLLRTMLGADYPARAKKLTERAKGGETVLQLDKGGAGARSLTVRADGINYTIASPARTLDLFWDDEADGSDKVGRMWLESVAIPRTTLTVENKVLMQEGKLIDVRRYVLEGTTWVYYVSELQPDGRWRSQKMTFYNDGNNTGSSFAHGQNTFSKTPPQLPSKPAEITRLGL